MTYLAATACLALRAFAGLDIAPKGDGVCVLRNGGELVSALAVDVGADEAGAWRSAWTTNADGCIVWNRWNERKEMRYRVEVARHPDGSVEISMSGQSDADSTLRTRMLNLDIPGKAFADRRFRHIDPAAVTGMSSFPPALSRATAANITATEMNGARYLP